MKNVKPAIKLATLVVYTNDYFEVEIWCPTDEALAALEAAVNDLQEDRRALREKAIEMGYEK